MRRRAGTTARMVMVAAVAAAALALPLTAQAGDASPMLSAQTLYLTERLTTSGPQVAHDASVLPESLVTLKGEREGFQVAFNNSTGRNLVLGGALSSDGALAAAEASGQISFELLRVGFVNVPQGSTRLGTSAGMYADPLPPLRNDSSAGRLNVAAGAWGGVAVIARVRTDAAAGVYSGTVELYEGANPHAGTVQVRVPFTLTVGNTRLLQTGERTSTGLQSFKTVLNVEGDAYWLQHADMRNKMVVDGTTYYADRMRQLVGLMTFLDSRNVTPLEMPFANPSPTGAYSCSYQDKFLPAFGYLPQLRDRYFGGARDVDPATPRFPARIASTGTQGCITSYALRGAPKGFHGTLDKYNTPGVKQDDVYNPEATKFFGNVASAWSTNGLWRSGASYVKSPFDEPGHKDARQKTVMRYEVPKANIALHRAFGAKAKVVLATWPRDSRKQRRCRKFGTGQRCTNLSGDDFDNRALWDGRGLDEVDVWMPHFSRMFGRTTPAKVARDYRIDRTRDYANRLRSIRAKKPGRETWAYNFYTATRAMPQLTIDAPGTDARLHYLMLGRDGHTGLFVSNLMMGWGSTALHSGSSLRRKGNPYEQALYFKHPIYGYAAGWGTFIYPGYVPELGLTGETLRNTEGAVPVSSLRLEGLRDGTEDGNLIQTYRARFGEAAVQKKLRTIFPGRSVLYPSTLGNVVGPYYSNGSNLAQRMELVRRQMIAELG